MGRSWGDIRKGNTVNLVMSDEDVYYWDSEKRVIQNKKKKWVISSNKTGE